MKPVVIFGNGLVASLAHFYLTHDSPTVVTAFTVDASHIQSDSLFDLPVVAFEDVAERFPPQDFDMFVAVGYGRMNKFREDRYNAAKAKGYHLINYVSSRASVWPDLEIGDNCFIMENNILAPFLRLGSNIIMFGGSQVGHDSIIRDNCFLSAHVVVSGHVVIEPNCFLGVNSTIRDSIHIARESVIGAGVVVTKSTTERVVLAAPRPTLLAITSDQLPHV